MFVFGVPCFMVSLLWYTPSHYLHQSLQIIEVTVIPKTCKSCIHRCGKNSMKLRRQVANQQPSQHLASRFLASVAPWQKVSKKQSGMHDSVWLSFFWGELLENISIYINIPKNVVETVIRTEHAGVTTVLLAISVGLWISKKNGLWLSTRSFEGRVIW